MSRLLPMLVFLVLLGVGAFLLFRVLNKASLDGFQATSPAQTAATAQSDAVVPLGGSRYPARDSGHPIRFFRVGSPRCPFEEIGEVQATVTRSTDGEQVRRLLATRIEELARSIGGDAVGPIDQDTRTEVVGGSGTPAAGIDYVTWRATVIRFEDPSCTD